jgi:anthranilate synthase component 1
LPPPDELTDLPETRTNLGHTQWTDAVEAAKEHILEGDIFQVVLSQRFDLVEPVDPLAVYRVLRLVNPSPYMYFLRHPEATIVGSSPEPMVQVIGDRVISRPIAGTRKRGRTPEHDQRLAAELAEHPKERAEHVMLVDLARNDVGRVVKYGTEKVEELMTLER